MKQKKLIAAIGAAVVLGFGGAAAQAADNFTGPYVGGALGLFSSTTLETDASLFGEDWDDTSTKIGSDDTFNQVDVVLGYGMLLQSRAYLGAELRYTVADSFKDSVASVRGGSDSLNIAVEGDGGYALMFQAGYAVSDNVVLYGTVGYVKRDWDVVYSATFEDNDTSGFSQSGTGIGFGAKYALTSNLLLNAEVVKTNFSSSKSVLVDDDVEDDEGLSVDADNLSASVSLMYRF